MNRGIFILLAAVALIGLAGLYLLKHGSSLFMHRPPTDRIAFVSTRDGQTDIWTMKSDGGDKRKFTNDEAEDTAPAWSPKGTEIVSASDREDGRYEIYISAWNGSYLKRLTSGAGTKDLPRWSPDGSEIVFLSSGAAHVRSRFGSDDNQVLPTVEQGATQFARAVLDVKWSANHRTLAAVQDAGAGQDVLVLEDFDNPERKPLRLNNSGELSIEPSEPLAGTANVAWAAEGYRIAVTFTDRKGADGKRTNGILIADLSSMGVSEVWSASVDMIGPAAPAWSPDGKRIAFEMWKISDRRPDRCIGLYVVSADGGEPKLLAKGEAMAPSWSPDGRYLAYTLAREDGRRDIWRIEADGKGAVSLTNGEGDNFQPVWSPPLKKR